MLVCCAIDPVTMVMMRDRPVYNVVGFETEASPTMRRTVDVVQGVTEDLQDWWDSHESPFSTWPSIVFGQHVYMCINTQTISEIDA